MGIEDDRLTQEQALKWETVRWEGPVVFLVGLTGNLPIRDAAFSEQYQAGSAPSP